MADNSKPLANRIALVTGASRGIGAELALQLTQAGAHVIAVARTSGALEELDDKIKSAGGSATLVPVDMKDGDGIARLALALNERYGKLDVMVGNAGVLGPLSPLDHVERSDFESNIAINVTANWWLIRTMDALLKRSDAGRAVFVTSGLGWHGRAYVGPYAASKAALNMLVQTYATESANTNVRVNAFSPGPTRTRMYASGWPGVDPATLNAPEDVAKAMLALCLPSCSENGKVWNYADGRFLSFRVPE
jgi:NAD(P)-dependent dehydrogenase (short-subunit alcohol dehydrogenase family)